MSSIRITSSLDPAAQRSTAERTSDWQTAHANGIEAEQITVSGLLLPTMVTIFALLAAVAMVALTFV